jgi:hypothetical protein
VTALESPAPTRSVDDATPTSVRVAVVAYELALSDLWRCVRSLNRSVQHAFDDPVVAPNAVTVTIGDCSGRRLVDEPALRDLRDGTDPRLHLDYTWFGRNLGHSGGCNALAADTAEDALLFFNPDTYASPRLLKRLLASLRDPAVVAVDARQIPCEHPKAYDRVTGDQSWASGACLMVRTSAFRDVGGFDAASFPLYVNDVDLSWRLRLRGGRVVHQPNAVVFHDKRLDRQAAMRPTRTQEYEGLLGRLLLATRYGRPDIVAETIGIVTASGSSEQRRGMREFERRRDRSELPEALPGAASVAEFVNGEYSRHRF